MSSDRELLELAAKAANVPAYWSVDGTLQHRPLFVVVAGGGMGTMRYEKEWNPLKNDDDAFRLAVQMGLDILRTERDVEALAGLPPNAKIDAHSVAAPCAVELLGDDPCAATRRAIVRASAAIAKAEGGV